VDKRHARYRFTTKRVDDRVEGWVAIELHRSEGNEGVDAKRVARVIFWDGDGQFYFEAFGAEIPLSIAEDLIAEAKAEIRTK
jgi:hypothetical protein